MMMMTTEFFLETREICCYLYGCFWIVNSLFGKMTLGVQMGAVWPE